MISEDQSFRFTTSNFRSERAIEVVRSEIKALESENEELTKKIAEVKSNPSLVIQSFEEELKKKIKLLRRENNSLSNTIEKSRYPGYVQMTKKKMNVQRSGEKMRSQLGDDNLLEGWENSSRRQFDDRSMTENQKFQASTCYNYENGIIENPIEALQPLSDSQLQSRTVLTAQVLKVIERTQKLKEEMAQVARNNDAVRPQNSRNQEQAFRKLQQYKKRLLGLVEKLKKKQKNLMKIISEYRAMYEETLKKLKEAHRVLKELEEAKVNENVDDMYAEVLQLEERLQYINSQLQRLDESKWLEEVYQELKKALKRIGMQIPKDHKENIRDGIDELCQLLIECNLSHQRDENEKINLLKHYHQEEKKNNKEIIQKLKTKEQALSKQLIQLQMNHQ